MSEKIDIIFYANKKELEILRVALLSGKLRKEVIESPNGFIVEDLIQEIEDAMEEILEPEKQEIQWKRITDTEFSLIYDKLEKQSFTFQDKVFFFAEASEDYRIKDGFVEKKTEPVKQENQKEAVER